MTTINTQVTQQFNLNHHSIHLNQHHPYFSGAVGHHLYLPFYQSLLTEAALGIIIVITATEKSIEPSYLFFFLLITFVFRVVASKFLGSWGFLGSITHWMNSVKVYITSLNNTYVHDFIFEGFRLYVSWSLFSPRSH